MAIRSYWFMLSFRQVEKSKNVLKGKFLDLSHTFEMKESSKHLVP